MTRKKLAGLSVAITLVFVGYLMSLPVLAVTVPSSSDLPALKQNSMVIASATASGRSEVTYTEHFHDDPDGDELTVSYWSNDGGVLAVKKLIFTDGGDIPDYELIDFRRQRGQRVIRDGGEIDISVFRIEADGSRKSIKSLSVGIKDRTIVDAGFHRHILKHWDDLVAGKKKRVNFLRVEKGNYVPLEIKRRKCDVQDGAICFRIALNNFLLKNLVPDIKLAYHPDLKRLVRYTGLGPLPKENGKGMPVKITYDYPQ